MNKKKGVDRFIVDVHKDQRVTENHFTDGVHTSGFLMLFEKAKRIKEFQTAQDRKRFSGIY